MTGRVLYVDNREGSKELLPLIRHAKSTLMAAGDAAFTGNGPEGPLEIGIEIKTLSDLAGSMRSGRLNEQLKKMMRSFNVCYLVIYGDYRVTGNGSGVFDERYQRTLEPSWTELWGRMLTIENHMNISVLWAPNIAAVAPMIWTTFTWWQREWGDHESYREVTIPTGFGIMGQTPACQVAACLPGIGKKKATMVGVHFGTVIDMVLADVKEWTAIDGIGKVTAGRCMKWLTERGMK